MTEESLTAFIQHDQFRLLEKLQDNTSAAWGKMNAQQMVEHLETLFLISSGKIQVPLSVPEEYLPKYKAFLYSDKEFRENTKAPENLMGEEPDPAKYESLTAAIGHLKESVHLFFNSFQQQAGLQTLHPSFGMLNLQEWLMLHGKHLRHHFRQFGLMA